MTIDLHSLIILDVALKRTAGTNGGEFHGACPFCGGKDRLAVWPFADRPSFWCRQCEKGGDAIQYLREKGMSYQDACAQLDIPLDRQQAARAFIPPVECKPPCQEWRAAAASFVLYAQAKLQSAPHILDYLTQRGLNRATIDKAMIGYNPATMERSRAKWGMEPHEKYGDVFWLSQGIVIPSHISNTFWKVQIRKEHVNDGEDRYKTVTGSSNALYNADSLTAGKPAMLVEGPFDALAVQQSAGDVIGVAACGTSGARRSRWLTKLALCNGVLVSLDADSAGDKGSAWWIENVEGARRWRPFYADPSQMLQDGADIRQWVLAGLGRSEPQALTFTGIPLEYWREEVRLECAVSLARLKRIVSELGADYDRTIAGLQKGG